MTTADTPESTETSVLAEPLAGSEAITKLDPSQPLQFSLLDRLSQLEEAMLARDPLMKTHLGAIHKQLIEHEELVHLLSNEEIAKIVSAQQQHVNTSLAAEVTSKSGNAKAAKRAASLQISDL